MNTKILAKIKRKMFRGYDDFYRCYCIEIEDWDKIVKSEDKK